MIDLLIKKILETENPTVVGLDPTYEMIPGYIKKEMLECYGKTPEAVAKMFLAFNMEIIDEIGGLVPAVKPQIAMYERYGYEGIKAYVETVSYAKEKGLMVIGDIKRGDIASTAEAYAAHIGGVMIEDRFWDPWKEDGITLNPYTGYDGIYPYLDYCHKREKGVFVLVKTSNPGSAQLQDKIVDGEPLYCHVASLVHEWGRNLLGNYGYSRVGAVVGATHKHVGGLLRKRLPSTFFLVPGYGAQGGKGKDLTGYFDKKGLGIIVNSSRGIIAAYQKDKEFGDAKHVGPEFTKAARKAVLAMRSDLQLAMEGKR